MSMIVKLNGIEAGEPIAERFAYCTADGQGATRPGGNVSPAIEWQGAPNEVQSYFLMVVDRDVPADFGPANKMGHVIAEDAPRKSFYHWLVADIPPVVARFNEGGEVTGQIGCNSFVDRAKGQKWL